MARSKSATARLVIMKLTGFRSIFGHMEKNISYIGLEAKEKCLLQINPIENAPLMNMFWRHVRCDMHTWNIKAC